MRHAVASDSRGPGALQLLEHRLEAVPVRDAVSLGQEEELAVGGLRADVEELVLVTTGGRDPAVARAQKRKDRLLHLSILPRGQGHDLIGIRVPGLVRPCSQGVDGGLALVLQREEN